jgi:hypothetical protein
MRRIATATILLALIVVTLSWGQTGEVQDRQVPKPAMSGALIGGDQETGGNREFPYSEPLLPPGIVTGDRPPLTFSSETVRSNFLTGSFLLASAFDDNALSTGSNHVSNVSYSMAPGIDVAQTRERWNWIFGYHPGFTFNQRLSEQNQSAHNLNFDTTYRLSPHVALRLRDAFEKTSTLFSGTFADQLTPGFGSLQQPNQFLITPLASRTGNTSSADLAYRFGASSIMGAGATYYFVNYQDVASSAGAPANLIDTQSLTAESYYAHRFANRHWLGAKYNLQRLNFDPGDRTNVQRVLLFYSLPLHDHMSLDLWAGPEYSNTLASGLTAVSSSSRWSASGGAACSWQGQRTGLRAQFSRRISDGGGLAQAVTLQQVSADFRYQLSARWTGILGASYADSDPLIRITNSFGKIQTLSENAGLEHRITDKFSLTLQYARDGQRYPEANPAQASANHNRVMLSLSYSFTRPLGR